MVVHNNYYNNTIIIIKAMWLLFILFNFVIVFIFNMRYIGLNGKSFSRIKCYISLPCILLYMAYKSTNSIILYFNYLYFIKTLFIINQRDIFHFLLLLLVIINDFNSSI